MNIGISTRKELESRIKNHIANGKVTEARVSVSCNERIIKNDGHGVNGIYVDTVVVVVVEDQDDDLQCVGLPGK